MLRELLAWVKRLNDKLSDQQASLEQETEKEVTMAMIYLDWSQKVSLCCQHLTFLMLCVCVYLSNCKLNQ